MGNYEKRFKPFKVSSDSLVNIMEANFLYKKEDRFKGAYAIQIAHLWCWSLMHYTSGIYEIPLGTAFASAINIDRVWRKSAKSNTVTCSNTRQIPNGVELSMGEILEKIK